METWQFSYYNVQMTLEQRLREAEDLRRTQAALKRFKLPAVFRSLLLLFL
jgi:hypothetical protein